MMTPAAQSIPLVNSYCARVPQLADILREHNYCRLREESEFEDSKVPVYRNYCGRGTIIPTGVTRTPYQCPDDTNKDTRREQKKLGILPSTAIIQIPVKLDNSVQIGDRHQATLPDFIGNDLVRDNDSERDVNIWTPRGQVDMKLEEEYLRVIAIQFNVQIPKETALQHLMENGYDFGVALETIDKKLKEVPQRLRPLSEVQYQSFHRHFLKKDTGLRVLQEECMRNYHLAEVHHFFHLYKNNHLGEANRPKTCNCSNSVQEKEDFVPRWSCSNCIKNFKPSSAASESLCLICQTYNKVTGSTRPAFKVVFNDDDLKKIEDWKRMEVKERRAISKAEFVNTQERETIERLMEMDLTDEEKSILDLTKLPHRRSKNLTDEQKKEIRLKMMEQMKPHPLPVVYRCHCVRGGEFVEVPKKKSTKRTSLAIGAFEQDVAHLPTKRERKKPKKFYE